MRVQRSGRRFAACSDGYTSEPVVMIAASSPPRTRTVLHTDADVDEALVATDAAFVAVAGAISET